MLDYTVISIISDNNVVNRKRFMSLSGSDHLMPYIDNQHLSNRLHLFIYIVKLNIIFCVLSVLPVMYE